jgi:hypothetical protein
VSLSNIPIINSAGQPVVQVVVGSTAQPSDGVVAANIAAVIGNLAFTSTPVTATVSGTSGVACVVTTPSCTLTNQQVWLGESGTSAPTGTYGFTTLIGAVINRGITLGSPVQEKSLAVSGTTSQYGYQEGHSITASPAQSPYTAAGYVPTSTSASGASNGGGLSFTAFANPSGIGGIDNILQITSAQLPSLLTNAGAYGESESIWVTGFPVYNQQTSPSIQNFALINAGGAYQVVFNKPIHEPRYTSGNNVNNAAFTLLGQNWTIVSYTLPGGGALVTGLTSTNTINGGKLGLATSLSPMATVYVGHNLTSSGFVVQLTDLGQPTSSGVSAASLAVYYNNVLTNTSSVYPGNTVKFNVTGHNLYVKINQTFAGLYAYQKWAKMQLYSNVYNITDGQVLNQTTNPGWNVNLLWTNTSGTTSPTDLQSIIIYNTTPVSTLLPGQSLNFIQSPKDFKVTFVGDTLGTANYDGLSIMSQYSSTVNYGNAVAKTATLSVSNVTEPAQELVVTSSIPNAFSFGGQTSSSMTYLLTNWYLAETSNTGMGQGAGQTANVVVSVVGGYPSANYITSSNPLLVTLTGYPSNTAGSTTSTTLTFVSGNAIATNAMQQGTFYNITQIKLNRALPGVQVAVYNGITIAGSNTLATLTYNTTPAIVYNINGKVYQGLTSGSSVIYNQQNGQPTSTFSISQSPTGTGLSGSNAQLFSFFTYAVGETNVPGSTSSNDVLQLHMVNSTAGVAATPLFQLNYSLTNQHANLTYTPSTAYGGTANNINANQGFRTERGSKIASITPTSISLNLATAVDQLQFVVGTGNTTVKTTGKTVGPYGIGQSTNLANVTIANVTAKCAFSTTSCTISGLANVTAKPSVTSAVTPVSLNTATTPLVVLDSAANPSATQIVVGSKYVNSVAAQIFAQNPTLSSSFGPSSVIESAEGSNRILVAGYYANQTVQAGNQFIQALLSAAGA